MKIPKSLKKSMLLLAALTPISIFSTAQAAEPVKACFVYVSPIGDAGFTFQHDKGRLEMETALKGQVVTSYVESVPEGPDAERVIREMATSGCKAIFATSFGYMNPTEKVARQFPNVAFFHGTGYKSNDTNFANYNARFYEGRYVNGIVAGEMTKTNILGYVAAFPIPEVIQGIDAFTLGARSVNPKVEVRVIWVNTWYDPGKERAAALTLLSQNADVLMHHTDSTAIVQAAQEKGKYAFGYHSDMSKYGADAQLSATIHEWGNYYTESMKAVLAGNWKPKNIWGGYSVEMIRTAPLNKAVPANVVAAVQKVEASIKANTFNPFTGPIKNQDGVVVVPAGQVMTDAEIGKLDFFVEGVASKLPKK